MSIQHWRWHAGVWALHDLALYLMIATVVGSYSISQHKEFRFVLPAFELLMPLVGLAVAPLLEPAKAQRQSPRGGAAAKPIKGSASAAAGNGTALGARAASGEQPGSSSPEHGPAKGESAAAAVGADKTAQQPPGAAR